MTKITALQPGLSWMPLILALVVATGCDGDSPADDDDITDDDDDVADDDDDDDDASDDDDTATAATQWVTSIEDHGVTWTFAEQAQAGQFVTGDWFVIGPATVQTIDPAPANGRHGSVLNLPPVNDAAGWDNRLVEGRYDAGMRTDPPMALVAGDTLLSSISVETVGQVDNWLREGNGESSESPVWSISVLTCLAEAPPADAFRPSYGDPDQRLYRLGDVDRGDIGSLALPAGVTVDGATLTEFGDRLGRPWVDNLFYAFDAQVEYMAMYGRETGRVAGLASMMLLADLPPDQAADQERLLMGLVQYGIDLWGLARAGYPGWYAHGGHGNGRKWFILWSGMLLGDAEMAAPTETYPDLQFGEDMHTAYAADCPDGGPAWWDGATVIYTGHMGIWDGEVVSSTDGWGPYEHLPPEQWVSSTGEGYRRCCTSLSWVGQALAAHLVGAEANWDHDAWFDYVDRWMDPTGDADYTQEILSRTGWDYTGSWAAHGQAWDDLVEQMWAEYR